MHKAISAFLAASAVLIASAHPANSIKVSGEIHNIPADGSRSLIINECDLSDKSKRCYAELDSAGRFTVDIPFYYGHTFTVNYNRDLFINAYAEPGDSVFVSIDASVSPVRFHLSGDHAALNEEYSHAFCDLSDVYYNVTLPPDTLPLSEYMPAFKSEVARTGAIVEKYVTDNNLMPETAEMLRLDNLFSIANQAVGFSGRGQEEQVAFFTDPLFDILNEKNLKVMIFPYHLSALMWCDPGYVKKMPKCVARDLMYSKVDEGEKPARDEFANPAYYDRLYADSGETIDVSALKSGRLVVMENDSVYNVARANPLDWLRARFSGRPVYVDVSATWCGPCRAALAGGEDLRQHFKNTDVVFAVIWLKSDIESWAQLAPSIHNIIHIFVPDEDVSNSMMSTLNLQGFPSCYVITRRGDLTGTAVPHFNDPALVDYLRSL